MSQSSFVPIPPSELGGAIAVNVFAILSTLGLLSVALKITWLLIRRHLLLTAPAEMQEHVFFNTQLGQYAACLLIAMVFSTTSGIIGISWVAQRGITEGWVCRLQATLMQIATWDAGYFTVTIAVHTFNSLVLKKRQSVILCRTTMSIGCIIAILAGLIPFMIHLQDGYVYGADGLTCGVRSVYPKLQFLFHILPILIASLLSAILYSLIFLVLRGTLKIRGGIQLTLNPNERWNNCEENYHRFIARVAKSMLWYPVAYTVLLIPYSIVRLLDISGFIVPFEATIFGFVCWFSLGIVDVLLLYNTFRVLTPAFDACSASAGTRRSMESFYTTGLQKFEYLTPPPSKIREKKISQYRNPDSSSSGLVRQGLAVKSSESFMPEPLPSHLDQSLTTQIDDRINLSPHSVGRSITPISDYNYIITTPPPSASPISRSGMERHDREYSPILAAGFPAPRQSRFAIASPDLRQSIGTYLSSNERVMFRQSTQTFGYQDSLQSKTSSWASDAVEISKWTRSPHPYILLPKTNEGQERLTISTSSFPNYSLTLEPPPLSSPVPTHIRGHSPLSTLSSPEPRR